MKFKDFAKWYEQNSSNSHWNSSMSSYCENVIRKLRNVKWWRRERVWKRNYEDIVLRNIVVPFKVKSSVWTFSKKTNQGSYAEGNQATAFGAHSHAEGYSGEYITPEGVYKDE